MVLRATKNFQVDFRDWMNPECWHFFNKMECTLVSESVQEQRRRKINGYSLYIILWINELIKWNEKLRHVSFDVSYKMNYIVLRWTNILFYETPGLPWCHLCCHCRHYSVRCHQLWTSMIKINYINCTDFWAHCDIKYTIFLWCHTTGQTLEYKERLTKSFLSLSNKQSMKTFADIF